MNAQTNFSFIPIQGSSRCTGHLKITAKFKCFNQDHPWIQGFPNKPRKVTTFLWLRSAYWMCAKCRTLLSVSSRCEAHRVVVASLWQSASPYEPCRQSLHVPKSQLIAPPLSRAPRCCCRDLSNRLVPTKTAGILLRLSCLYWLYES